jgi:RNA polymerase sigma factor (sigma-70 family)
VLLLNSGTGPAGDTELMVRAAQQGDPHGFARLYELHYAGMLAVASQILGSGPDAEDVCQDAAITAFARIGELRDPSAVRPWLNTIVRNNCRTLLRARRPVPVGVAGEDLPASALDDPFARIERSALRDWIWHGLRQLSPAVLPAALLRYFTENNSYEQIAALCGIPVGTVRSRLSEARRQLTAALPRVRDERHEDCAALFAERRQEAAAFLSSAAALSSPASVHGRFADDLTMHWPDGQRSTGLKPILEAMASAYHDGITYRLNTVVAAAGITIWDIEFVNPPEDPEHCPPSGTWMMRESEGRIRRIRLLQTSRPGAEKTGPLNRTSGRGPKS